MRKIAILSAFTLVLLACSLTDIPSLVPALPTLQLAATAAPLPTGTATLPFPPTYTYTPTMIGARPSETPTQTPFPTGTASLNTPTPVNTIIGPAITPTLLPGATGFDFILLSTSQIYLGACGTNEVTFTVQVTKPAKIESVVLFLRLRSLVTAGQETSWDRGTAMDNEGKGNFTYSLNSSRFKDQNNSVILYQLVGTDDEQKIVARSPVFSDGLTLLKCP